jgi:hexokinase
MQITKDAEGILMSLSKEVDAPDLIGKSIGRGLKEALARRKLKVPERVFLLNDTSATLLSGCADMGFILGTGINAAYLESRIPKIGFDNSSAPQVLDCESGNFDTGCLGVLDREFDAATQNPGTFTLEKASAGAYLGSLSLHILKRAIRDKVLIFRRSKEFLDWPRLETKDLNDFMWSSGNGQCDDCSGSPFAGLFGADETEALKSLVYLVSIINERAGILAALMLAGIIEHLRGGFDPLRPFRIAVEGTTFLRYKGLREALESSLYETLSAKGPRNYIIQPVEQASLFGAAGAAASQV